ncbi:pollen-specific leucine-rich repeat extensin-like protein 3 [Iris pallida]|uniref:Pollen-specific leucine-rich repeat extensin-like protein 3 n=1 Tax=Iris pallida TaxID=29817 RepID=A0AAX6E8U7_IRIPA|nr:pollen-specific leucine-rich repeat extensin-like protein 3 [Iris pallida]
MGERESRLMERTREERGILRGEGSVLTEHEIAGGDSLARLPETRTAVRSKVKGRHGLSSEGRRCGRRCGLGGASEVGAPRRRAVGGKGPAWSTVGGRAAHGSRRRAPLARTRRASSRHEDLPGRGGSLPTSGAHLVEDCGGCPAIVLAGWPSTRSTDSSPRGGVAPGRRGRCCWHRHRLEGAVAPQLCRPEDESPPVISGGEEKLGGDAERTTVGVVRRIGGARGGGIGAFRRFWTTAVTLAIGASTATRVVLIVAGMVAPEFESARGNTTGKGCEGSINHCRVGSAAAARRTPAGTGGRWSRAASGECSTVSLWLPFLLCWLLGRPCRPVDTDTGFG